MRFTSCNSALGMLTSQLASLSKPVGPVGTGKVSKKFAKPAKSS